MQKASIQIIIFIQLILVTMFFAAKSETDSVPERHPHDGKVSPFSAGNPNIKLSDEAVEVLEAGSPFKTQIQDGSTGRGLVVQDVHATTDIVWEKILDFNQYNTMVPNTVFSENYREESNDEHKVIFTQMQVGFPMLKLKFFIRHEYHPKLNSLTWTLDYDRKSDLDDSCGFWYVVPHPTKPQWSRVYYSVDVAMFDWVPSFVVKFMSQQALTEATGWVKKYSEIEYGMRPLVMGNVYADVGAGADVDGIDGRSSSDEQLRKENPKRLDKKETTETETSDSETVTTTQTCDSYQNDFPSECENDIRLNLKGEVVPSVPAIGLSRYVLVGSVICLSLYNIHLYLSR